MFAWGADANIVTQDNHLSALFMSLLHDRPDATKTLLESGADPNSVDWQGFSVLSIAHRLETVNQLLDAGADVDSVDKDGKTALMYSVLH